LEDAEKIGWQTTVRLYQTCEAAIQSYSQSYPNRHYANQSRFQHADVEGTFREDFRPAELASAAYACHTREKCHSEEGRWLFIQNDKTAWHDERKTEIGKKWVCCVVDF
jgi:hypothetical protein